MNWLLAISQKLGFSFVVKGNKWILYFC